MPTSAEIRERARNSLRGKWGPAIGFIVVMMVIGAILGGIARIPVIGWIVVLLASGPLMLSYSIYFLKLARGGSPTIGEALESYQKFGKAFVLYLLQAIFVWLWSLLLIVPGIIASLRYSMAWFILQDQPDIGGQEAIARSKQLMVGHKGRLFVLYLTFIGWGILCCVTLGIGFLWLYPYIQTAKPAFYQDLLDRNPGFLQPNGSFTD